MYVEPTAAGYLCKSQIRPLKWNIATISELELPSHHVPISIEIKKVYAALLVINSFHPTTNFPTGETQIYRCFHGMISNKLLSLDSLTLTITKGSRRTRTLWYIIFIAFVRRKPHSVGSFRNLYKLDLFKSKDILAAYLHTYSYVHTTLNSNTRPRIAVESCIGWILV